MTEHTLDYDKITAQYARMRQVGFELNMALAKCLSQEAIDATAKALGLWRDGTLVFDTQDQSAVLFDQAIHGYFRDGRNAIDRYADEHPPAPGSDQEAVLAASKRAFHSLFQVEHIVPDVGVHVRDGLYDGRHFLADVGCSRSAKEGWVLVSRVVAIDDFIMTTGAPLPVDRAALEKISQLAALENSARDFPNMSRQELADVAATIIRLCLDGHASRSIRYEDFDENADSGADAVTETSHVGRNAPCPCGSGKKYKKCCINKHR